MTQLDTTLDGSWEQTTTEDGLEYKHTSGVLRVVRYAPDEVDFALCVTLDPDVYGGLDTLSNVVIGPDGTIYTPGGEYGTFERKKSALHGKKCRALCGFSWRCSGGSRPCRRSGCRFAGRACGAGG